MVKWALRSPLNRTTQVPPHGHPLEGSLSIATVSFVLGVTSTEGTLIKIWRAPWNWERMLSGAMIAMWHSLAYLFRSKVHGPSTRAKPPSFSQLVSVRESEGRWCRSPCRTKSQTQQPTAKCPPCCSQSRACTWCKSGRIRRCPGRGETTGCQVECASLVNAA